MRAEGGFVYFSLVSTYSSTSISSAIATDLHVMEDSCLIDNCVSSSSTTTILTSQSVRAALPPVLQELLPFRLLYIICIIILYIILFLLLEYMTDGIFFTYLSSECMNFWSIEFFSIFGNSFLML